MSVKQQWIVELDVYSKCWDDSTFLEPEDIIIAIEDELKQWQMQKEPATLFFKVRAIRGGWDA